MSNLGHLGTHIDNLNKEFPLDYIVLRGQVFNVSGIRGRDIEILDADLSGVSDGGFVLFHTGYPAEAHFGSDEYSKNHPQLSSKLIKSLVERRVNLIGIDAAGIRRGGEHAPADQYCADKGVFVVENLVNLDKLWQEAGKREFSLYTFPLFLEGAMGVPCRAIAEL